MNAKRDYSLGDKICLGIDQMLRTMTDNLAATKPSPGDVMAETPLSEAQRKHSAALMRINHAGEVCAQALYQGQALVSRSPHIQQEMQQAAAEESDHLAWCKQRLIELNSHTSYLNPLWYTGSFLIGMSAGMIGDAWSLGFVVETERQVIKHLEQHLKLLPKQDARSYFILQKMENDEAQHRDAALAAGARELPTVVKSLMSYAAKIMVKTAYWF